MRIRVFELCDAAVVRDNMLSVVNGGINSMPRDDFPATMQCDLAVALELDLHEGHFDLEASLHMVSDDGIDCGVAPLNIGADLQLSPGNEPATAEESIVFPQAIGLRNLTLPQPGSYRLELRSRGELVTFLRFAMWKSE